MVALLKATCSSKIRLVVPFGRMTAALKSAASRIITGASYFEEEAVGLEPSVV